VYAATRREIAPDWHSTPAIEVVAAMKNVLSATSALRREPIAEGVG